MARSNRVNLSVYAFWCLSLSVALLPIGLGGDRPIPMGLAQCGLAFCCIFCASSHDMWTDLHFFKRIRIACYMLAAVVAWAFIQTQSVVPASWVHPLWQEAAGVLKVPVHGSIAVAPEDSLKGLSDLITYILCGILAYIVAQHPARARKLVEIIWLSGVVVAAYGVIVYLSGMNKILWFDKWAYENDLTSTFVNRNHYALYAGIVLVCGASLLQQGFEEDVRRKKPHQRLEALKEWLMHQALPQCLLMGMVIVSIMMSHSRAGLLVDVLGLCGYFFIYQLYLKRWRRAIVVAIIAAILIGIILFVAVQVSERFATLFSDYSSLDRYEVYQLGLNALSDNLWLGYGLNGFEPEFRLYQTDMVVEFNHAHSDILESLLDLGIPFGVLLWSSIAVLLTGLWHGVKHRRQMGMFPVLGLTVSLMVLVHAFVDFDLQIPGIVLIWVSILGAGLAQSWTHAQKQALSTRKQRHRAGAPAKARPA